jgi:hypothetical protein
MSGPNVCRDYLCEDCMNMYSPGMFTTSQCQNLIGPTNKTKQWIIFFIYKNTTNLDRLYLLTKKYSTYLSLFKVRETHNFNTRFNQNFKEKAFDFFPVERLD